MFVAPSVTPWRFKLKSGQTGPPHNPSVRLVTYDRDSGRHLNVEQFRLDLPAANTQGTANFSLLYSLTEVACVVTPPLPAFPFISLL